MDQDERRESCILDILPHEWQKAIERKQLVPYCPNPDRCLPMECQTDSIGAGICAGIIHIQSPSESDNNETVSFCRFRCIKNEDGTEYIESFRIPMSFHEALRMSHVLLSAVRQENEMDPRLFSRMMDEDEFPEGVDGDEDPGPCPPDVTRPSSDTVQDRFPKDAQHIDGYV